MYEHRACVAQRVRTQYEFGALQEFHWYCSLERRVCSWHMGDATNNHPVQHHKDHGGFLTASFACSSRLPMEAIPERWKVKTIFSSVGHANRML